MEEDTACVVILVTATSNEEAHRITDELLNRRKVACVNIVSDVSSQFWWQGELESADEHLLIIKTKASLLDEIVTLVSQIHSYEVPEIIALPIVGGNRDYLEWVHKEVG